MGSGFPPTETLIWRIYTTGAVRGFQKGGRGGGGGVGGGREWGGGGREGVGGGCSKYVKALVLLNHNMISNIKNTNVSIKPMSDVVSKCVFFLKKI